MATTLFMPPAAAASSSLMIPSVKAKLYSTTISKISCNNGRSFAVVSTDHDDSEIGVGPAKAKKEHHHHQPWAFLDADIPDNERFGIKEFFKLSKDLLLNSCHFKQGPFWFSPTSESPLLSNAPLLIFLPGIDGTGLGLIRQHQRLSKIFDVRCLHIPPSDRTLFPDLVKLVERTISSENCRSPNRPIYLVGESLGGCLALAVAARNPNIDLSLILANPATSFTKSQLQKLLPLLEVMPGKLHLSMPHMLSLLAGNHLRTAMSLVRNGLDLQQMVKELSQNLEVLPSYISVLANVLPKETLLWRLQLLKSGSEYTNSRLHAVDAQTLVLISGKDQLLPSYEEGKRLFGTIKNCGVRTFDDKGHLLFLEEGFDLVTIIKETRFYRRSKYTDHVSDYIPPTPSETQAALESMRLLNMALAPVMLSTMNDGRIVHGLAGIPSEGPVLLVGYHNLFGLDVVPLVSKVFTERNILVRGMAHPFVFTTYKTEIIPPSSSYDVFKLVGAVPVSAANFYKLLSSNSHILLYPGGAREALHRKGEAYRLFWPEQAEFVRMAARFGAKIIPFGSVGEDDIGEVIVDYDDFMKIPYFRAQIEELKKHAATVRLRADAKGEVVNQDFHLPWIRPKFPGRFYYYFGKPIETEGRKQELRDRDRSHELYLQVQREVERCIMYLKEKREKDPYRNFLSRLYFQVIHGLTSEIPTFPL